METKTLFNIAYKKANMSTLYFNQSQAVCSLSSKIVRASQGIALTIYFYNQINECCVMYFTDRVRGTDGQVSV